MQYRLTSTVNGWRPKAPHWEPTMVLAWPSNWLSSNRTTLNTVRWSVYSQETRRHSWQVHRAWRLILWRATTSSTWIAKTKDRCLFHAQAVKPPLPRLISREKKLQPIPSSSNAPSRDLLADTLAMTLRKREQMPSRYCRDSCTRRCKNLTFALHRSILEGCTTPSPETVRLSSPFQVSTRKQWEWIGMYLPQK